MSKDRSADQPGPGDDPGASADRGPGTPRGPELLADTCAVARAEPTDRGALWKLDTAERDLDSNIIAIPPHGQIDTHETQIDVLIHVLAGAGQVHGQQSAVELRPGALVWLPRGSPRRFTAGVQGVRYLTVHQRKPGLSLGPTRRQTS